jgi:transposase
MSKPHGNYSTEYRQQAVDLLISSGRPLKVVAADLGISANSLRLWRNRADAAAEIRRLHRENEYLRRQREILKKAVSILSEDPQSGMH